MFPVRETVWGWGIKGRRRCRPTKKPTGGKAAFTNAVQANHSHDISGKKRATIWNQRQEVEETDDKPWPKEITAGLHECIFTEVFGKTLLATMFKKKEVMMKPWTAAGCRGTGAGWFGMHSIVPSARATCSQRSPKERTARRTWWWLSSGVPVGGDTMKSTSVVGFRRKSISVLLFFLFYVLLWTSVEPLPLALWAASVIDLFIGIKWKSFDHKTKACLELWIMRSNVQAYLFFLPPTSLCVWAKMPGK